MQTVHLTATADELEKVRVDIRAVPVHPGWSRIDATLAAYEVVFEEDRNGDK